MFPEFVKNRFTHTLFLKKNFAVAFFLVLYFSSLLPLTGKSQQKYRLTDQWEFVKGDLGGVWEAIRPVKKGNPEAVPAWQPVQLPHCFNATDAVDPDQPYYQGPAWYRTRLYLKNPYKGGRTLLHFEGAGQKSAVYVYDRLVQTHVGGYDEWTVDITDAAAAFSKTKTCKDDFGEAIPVSIRVDNSRDLEMIPSDLSDFTIYGGLYRYVNLIYTPALSIDKVFAKAEATPNSANGQLQIRLRLDNPTHRSAALARIELKDPDGQLVKQDQFPVNALQKEINSKTYNIPNPRLWYCDTPRLYSLTCTIISGKDSCSSTEKIGFRFFEFRKKGPFYLNGSRLLLQGTHRHEDHAGTGQAMTEDMMRTEMYLMKEMGVNFIRLGHYQQSRIILQLCDSLGILVWEEIPWCRGGLGGSTYRLQAKRMLTHMIEQHYNHPAVIIWGLGNENDWPGDFPQYDSAAIRRFMSELNILAHRLDPGRKTAIRRCAFCSDIVDVYSPSIWAGWYRGVYTEYRDVTWAEFEKVDHFLHVEWGGDSHARRHSENPDKALLLVPKAGAADERSGDASLYGGAARVSKDGDWSESYICNLIDWHLKEQLTMPWLSGTAQWVFKDFATPIRPDNPVPYVNQKGVIERDFTKKESYYVFQSYWSKKPMAHLYGHSQPIRWGAEGEKKMIKVYSNCETAELFVNGKSQGIKKRVPADFPAAGLRWEVPLYQGNYKLKLLARENGVLVTDSTEFYYLSEQWGKPEKLMLSRVSEKEGVITAEARLVDAKGLPCLDGAQVIRFGIAGDGELIDDQGTSTGSRQLQLYNGRALINVKSLNGQSIISAHVEGLPTAFLALE